MTKDPKAWIKSTIKSRNARTWQRASTTYPVMSLDDIMSWYNASKPGDSVDFVPSCDDARDAAFHLDGLRKVCVFNIRVNPDVYAFRMTSISEKTAEKLTELRYSDVRLTSLPSEGMIHA